MKNLGKLLSASFAGAAMLAVVTAAQAAIIYDSITGGLQEWSQGYQCCGHPNQLVEIGDHIGFAGSARSLTTVTVSMKQFAVNPPAVIPYTHSLTFNLYSGVNPDTLIASRTASLTISAAGSFDVDFDFTGVVVPDQIYYGVYNDISGDGAQDALNIELWNVSAPFNNPTGPEGAIPVGTDLEGNIVYSRNGALGSPFIDDGGSNDLNAGFTPAVRFNAEVVPLPGTLALLSLGLAGLGFSTRRGKTA